MTHAERRDRRGQIVAACLAGKTIREIAAEFNVSKTLVLLAAKQSGVEIADGRKKPENAVRFQETAARYEAGESVDSLAESYGVTSTRIYQILRTNGVALRDDREIPKEEQEEIARLYSEGSTYVELIKQFRRGSAAIGHIVHDAGLDVARQSKLNRSSGLRKYSLNESYFDLADNERVCWLIGFLAGDAGISSGKGSYMIVLNLKGGDRPILETIRQELGYDGPIRDGVTMCRGKEFPKSTLQIASVRLVEALDKFGVTPQKSLTAKPWEAPPHLMRHFLRGLLDANGSISKSASSWRLSFCGTEAMVLRMIEFCREISGTEAGIYKPPSQCWTVNFGGNLNVSKLIHHFYSDITIALPRKWEKAKQVMLEHPLTPS